MTIMLFLLGLSLAMGAVGLLVFLWCLRSGQYDDPEGAANRILFDDPSPPPASPDADRVRPPAPEGPS
jgi:cbb3-type cytochrome oxidase maturation protein